MKFDIIPLDCGEVTEVQVAAHQYMSGFGQTCCARMVLWLIRGPGIEIVVDQPPSNVAMVKERFNRDLLQTPAQHPRAAVEAAGSDPDAIQAVVQSHLHWDHCLGMEENLFPNADVYLQMDELRYAAVPYPPHNGLYDKSLLKKLLPSYASEFPQVKLITGDFRLAEGIHLAHLPGHTPGLMATLVDTGTKTVAIASDTVPFQSSWNGRTVNDWIPEGIHVSLDDCYRAMSRLAREADVILPSHDSCVLEPGAIDGGHGHEH